MLQLKIGSQTKTLADWQIENPQLTINSCAPDELSFSTAAFRFATAFFSIDTPVELFFAGSRIFCGFLGAPNISKSLGADSVSYTAKGLLDVFNSTYYHNTWQGTNQTDCTQTQIFGKKQDIKIDGSGGFYVSETLTEYSAQAFFDSDFRDVFSASQNSSLFEIPAGAVNFNSSLQLPISEQDSCTFADVFDAFLNWHPEMLSWFDYSSDLPQLFFKAAAVCDAENLPVSKIESVNISKDYSTRLNVVLRVIEYKTRRNPGSWIKYKGFTDYADSGVAASNRNVVVLPVDRCGDNYNNRAIDTAAILARLKEIVNTDALSGSVALLDKNFAHRYVGKRISITGSRDDLSSIDSPVQSDTMDLTTGMRELKIGNDNRLGAEDWIDRLEYFLRKRKFQTPFKLS